MKLRLKFHLLLFWKLEQSSGPESWQWIMLHECPDHIVDLWNSVTETNLWKNKPILPNSSLIPFLLLKLLFNVLNLQHHFEKNIRLLLNPKNVSVCLCLSLYHCTYSYLKLILKIDMVVKKKNQNNKKLQMGFVPWLEKHCKIILTPHFQETGSRT